MYTERINLSKEIKIMPTELEKKILNFNHYHGANMSVDKLEKTLQKKKIKAKDIFLMMMDSKGNQNIVKKV